MCGLIGTFTKSNFGFTDREVEAFQELLFLDTVRGMDSTGAVSVRNTGNVAVAKAATWGPSFIATKTFQSLCKDMSKDGKILAGHNRKATVGQVVDENAHPFVVNDEFILMHNGSLPTHSHLAPGFAVDSEAIAHYLYQNWDDDASPADKAKVLEKLGGAWALVWYDLRTEKLNIVRNSQRPMNIAESSSTWFYSSDLNILKTAVERNSYTKGSYREVPPHVLLTFDGESLKETPLPFFTKVVPITAGSTKGCTGTTEQSDEVSRNQFKRTLRTLQGKSIPVTVNDFQVIGGKLFWYGASPNIPFNHELVGTSEEKLLTEIMDKYGFAEGRVIYGSYDKETKSGRFNITLERACETSFSD